MDVSTVGIVGCGVMGSGVAEVVALAGFNVVVVKATAGSLDTAIRRVEGALDRGVSRGKVSREARDAARARITFSADLDALGACDLVIECTVETIASKKRMLVEIEAATAPHAIVASNTSALPLTQLAAALKRPERFIGLHFFSPVSAMKLVEVGRLPRTGSDAISAACRFVEALGKTPILLGDEPGYVVNRLLVPYLCQAIDMLESGVARAHEIDTAMKLGCGHPLGPLAMCDAIGLDVVFAMAQTLSNELRDKRFKPPTLLRRLVLAGNLGRKTKLGLYDYRRGEPTENAEIRAALCSVPDLGAVSA